MILNAKYNNCKEPSKRITGFWDGKCGAHGCLYDCDNLECDVKQIMVETERITQETKNTVAI